MAEAKEAAVANAPCVLIVQDVDRLARGAGDAPGAADHLGELFFQLRRQRVTIWTARTGEVDSIRAVLEGERSHSESQRKSQATRSGIKRRKARGAPVGPIPFGYRVERDVVAGQVIASRVVNPDRAAVITETFTAIATGASPGDAARMLNARGVRTQRGKTWTARAVRQLVANPAYRGERGYPRLVPDALYAKANGSLRRLDPAAVQRRRGGRPTSEKYILRGLAFCSCGAPLYATTGRYGTHRDRHLRLQAPSRVQRRLCRAGDLRAARGVPRPGAPAVVRR